MGNKFNIKAMVPRGSGAWVVHKSLEKSIPGYSLNDYHPYWELFPVALPVVVPPAGAHLIHTPADYGYFFYRPYLPVVLTFHNYVIDSDMVPYSSMAQKMHYLTTLRKWILLGVKNASVITAVSRYTAELARKDLPITGKPVRVIYNGIDNEHFRPDMKKRSGSKKIRVLYSGNLSLRKGSQWLAAIADRLEPSITIFYTKGLRSRKSLPPRNNLKSIGAVPYADMPNRYRDMDILLMPTVREGFGLSIAEAMACGLPVVASDCSAIPELVENEKGGFLCPVGDVSAFAEKINFLANAPKLRREMGEYNRNRIENLFTVELMVKKYLALFEEVLS